MRRYYSPGIDRGSTGLPGGSIHLEGYSLLPSSAGTLGAPETSEELVLARPPALDFSSNHRWQNG